VSSPLSIDLSLAESASSLRQTLRRLVKQELYIVQFHSNLAHSFHHPEFISSLPPCLVSHKFLSDGNQQISSMRVSSGVLALIAFCSVSAAPVAVAEAEAAPHNYFSSRYGYDGYRTPHFVEVGRWKRDASVKAGTVVKRDGPEWRPNEQETRCECF
jgi:hypothetical protein